MSNPTKEYLAMPLEDEEYDYPGNWAPLSHPDVAEGYQISDLGQILSPSGTLLKPGLNGSQMYVTLQQGNGSGKGMRIDKMVLETFASEGGPGLVPIHKDGDNANCALENLVWGPPPVRNGKSNGHAPPAGVTKPKTKTTKTRKSRAKTKADYDHITVSRHYRHEGTGLSVSVGEDGKAKMPKVNLTAEEMRAVALLSQRIAEMNEILGLGHR